MIKELDIEQNFVEKLIDLKYIYRDDIKDRNSLERNFKAAWSTVSQDMYNQPGDNPQQEQQTNSQEQSSNSSNQDGEVTDADFEEVK